MGTTKGPLGQSAGINADGFPILPNDKLETGRVCSRHPRTFLAFEAGG